MRFVENVLLQAAELVRELWHDAYNGAKLPGMRKAVRDETLRASLSDPNAIQMIESGNERTTISIAPLDQDQPTASRIENGYASFDMKPGLLNGQKSKSTKDGGRYAVVPFNHKVHGSKVGPKGQILNRRQSIRARQGDSFNEDLQGLVKIAHLINVEAVQRGLEAPMKADYEWKSGKLMGMKRYEVGTEDSPRGKYFTFRVVSSKSDPNSWIHPGQAANPVRDAVAGTVAPMIEGQLSEAFKKDITVKIMSDLKI